MVPAEPDYDNILGDKQMSIHISIINPEGIKPSAKGFINALSAYTILEINNLTGCANIADYFTTDPAVINHRMDLFFDILNNEPLYNFLNEAESKLKGLELELNSKTAAINNGETMLSKIYVLKYYIDMLDWMYDFLKNDSQNFKSEGLLILSGQIITEAESDEYKTFKKSLTSFDDNVKDIHSITVGVNLDMQLHPKEAGIISINKEMYKSGNIIDKILRWDFKDDEYTCLAPLTSLNGPLSIQEQAESNRIINHAMDIVFMDTLKKCYDPIKKFINERYEMFIGLRDEIKFLLRISEMLRSFKDANMPFCKPRISESEYSIKGLYNPFIIKNKDSGKIVLNDITFDDEGKIYILTGANSGGKSVFPCRSG
jgi:DNA mismatch repair protein MutS